MQIFIPKRQAFIILLLVVFSVLNPVSADNKKNEEWDDIGISEERKKISIKKIRELGDNEFSYQNSDNNIILVKCEDNKILMRYWYITQIDTYSKEEATNKMRWHRATPQSQAQQESKFVCNNHKN
jgi:hypothetical protein